MKKKSTNGSSIHNNFIVSRNGEILRLEKGFSKKETISVMGEPFKTEQCNNELNEKLIFKVNNGRLSGAIYSIMFTNDELIYVAKS